MTLIGNHENPAWRGRTCSQHTTKQGDAGMRQSRERIIGAAVLAVILVIGGYLVWRNWRAPDQPPPANTTPEEQPGPDVPLIDIAMEKAEGGVDFELGKPRFKTEGERVAAFANATVPLAITRDQLIVTAKNALIGLYEQIDPLQQRWLEVRLFLDGAPPVAEGAAAVGILNADQLGFGDDLAGQSPWRLRIRLITREARGELGIDDDLLQRTLAAQQMLEQTRTALLVEGLTKPSDARLLSETARRHRISLGRLRKLAEVHAKLFTDDFRVDADLK